MQTDSVSSNTPVPVDNADTSGDAPEQAQAQFANEVDANIQAQQTGGESTESTPADGANGPADDTLSGTGLAENTAQAAGTLIDPANEIARLNSDGDRVVMSMTGEGKLQLPTPAGVGVGLKGQYGYSITVQQVGDDQRPGANDQPPAYEVTFDKNLSGGGVIEPPVPGIDPAAELNLRTTGSVTMQFATEQEAAQAVNILQRLALEESLRDAGSALSPAPDLSNPASNPVADTGESILSLPNPIADAVGPTDSEMAFLRGHVTEYSSAIGLQERGKIAAKFANLGIEPRLDANQTLTRTVVLPQNGEAGSVTYTLSGNLQASTKEKLTIGKQEIDQLEIGYVPQNIVDHGQLRGEVSMTWELPPEAFDTSLSGQPVPELNTLLSGNLPDAPDRISAKLQLDYQTQSLLDLSRTDMQRLSFEVSSDNPANAAPAINDLLSGDLEGSLRGMGDDLTVTVKNEEVRRDGVHQQHEIGIEFADIVEGKVSLIGNVGLDDITDRRTATFTGDQLADRLFGPGETSTVGDPPAPSAPQTETLVVVPRDGLNVREAPSADTGKISAFQNGTFVTPTGQEATDANGRNWVEVSGLDANDRVVQGWVAADYVRPHENGAMDERGRINPELEAQGYEAHTVTEGDTIWDLAHRDGANFRDMLELNRDHLIDPTLIFPGDTVYIPGTGNPVQPPAPEPTPPVPTQPSAPSSEESATSEDNPSTGVPSNDGHDSAPSTDDTPSTGAPSDPGDESLSQPPDDTAPVTPPGNTPVQPGVPAASRPDLDGILRDYQVVDDPGGMIDWEPNGGLLKDMGALFTDPMRMTATEGQLLDQRSALDIVGMNNVKDEAWSTAIERFPAPEEKRGNFPTEERFQSWASNDGHRDAFRHAYWNALMTQRFGEDFTERFTTAHEGAPNNLADREAMDLYNNEVGRRIGAENPTASPREIADLVQQRLNNGELIVIGANGELAWSDQVAYGEHGTANDPATPGVIQTPDARDTESR